MINTISSTLKFFELYLAEAALQPIKEGRTEEAAGLLATAAQIRESMKTLADTGRINTAEIIDITEHFLTLRNAEKYFYKLHMDRTGLIYPAFEKAIKKTWQYLKNISGSEQMKKLA